MVKVLLAARPAGAETVLCQRDGSPWSFHAWIRKVWRKALEAAGIPAGRRWHDMRGYFASKLAEDGVPETVIMALGGWSTPSVFRRYRRVRWTEKAKAMGWGGGADSAAGRGRLGADRATGST